MAQTDKLLRDIHDLSESIQIDQAELCSNPLREAEIKALRTHLELCQAKLKALIAQLCALEEGSPI
jgi:hypothetical protein